jgi:hypothetical protein
VIRPGFDFEKELFRVKKDCALFCAHRPPKIVTTGGRELKAKIAAIGAVIQANAPRSSGAAADQCERVLVVNEKSAVSSKD